MAGVAGAQSLSGLWDGTVNYDEDRIPFLIQFSQKGDDVTAAFFNGDEQVTSTAGRLTNGALTVNFDHYATRLNATLANGVITGTYGGSRNGFHDFEAKPHVAATNKSAHGPKISGVWTIPTESPKGEHAWRLIVQQRKGQTSAAILRVDGDTGLYTGWFENGKFVLNHFDGARAGVLEIEPKEDGSLGLFIKGFKNPGKTYVAFRAADAKAKGLPEPTDAAEHTRLKNPGEPLRFSFPDLNGKTVSNTDEQFRGKVLLVNITGSWCPNCHDEAPFLEALYREYHGQGLEIIALDFEDAEQLKDPARLHAFIQKYGIQYTYLLAGLTTELQEKVPQAENLNSWPTTFFIGRDGKVRFIHAGFAAPASGEFHTALKKEVHVEIEKLLSENVRTAHSLGEKAAQEDGTFKSFEELKEIYGSEGVNGDKPAIAYCRISERSSYSWFVLKYLLGYRDVVNYDGSWTEWGNLVGAPIERGGALPVGVATHAG
jgi:thiol-disulfide isomerase/thioredoxin